MPTDEQNRKISKALSLITSGQIARNPREWDNLFEDGEDDANAVVLGIIGAIQRNGHSDKSVITGVIDQSDYMPMIVYECALSRLASITKDEESLISNIKKALDKLEKEQGLYYLDGDERAILYGYRNGRGATIRYISNEISNFYNN